ncbi:hypothetical protein HMSSN139_46790 [Paenibacillus sp. HMSSN-139]|nr:hypothetical protein HMSSN139_46790 [Paenibacillus sp. HMSSN-139]
MKNIRLNMASALVGALALILFLFGGSTAAPVHAAEAAQADGYLIVALGDSITAGYEPGMTETSVPYGFVERLKEQGLFHGRTSAVNYGILGLTSEGLKNYITAIQAGSPVAAADIQPNVQDPRIASFASGIGQAKADLQKADLITITIGGNDLLRLLPDVKNISLEQLRAQSEEVLKAYGDNLREVVRILTELNPSAQIVLADQYQPVPKLAGASIYDELQQLAGKFTAIVDGVVADSAAQAKPIKAAHVATAFTGREISLTHIFRIPISIRIKPDTRKSPRSSPKRSGGASGQQRQRPEARRFPSWSKVKS